MKLLCLFLLCALTVPAAKHASLIPPGAKVFIVPDNGFETYLTAAIEKKQLNLIVVATKEAADYTIDSTSDSQKAGWAKTIFVSPRSEESASIRLFKNGSDEVLFAYAVNKFSSVHGKQSTAEACAKHLKQAMGK